MKNYNVSSISGDRFAGIWPVEQFRKFNIRYEQSAEPKSDLYQSLLPLINSRRIDLLDNPKLINQLIGLERRTARGGRDSIDHGPGGHDRQPETLLLVPKSSRSTTNLIPMTSSQKQG